jgi:hypothetical protein
MGVHRIARAVVLALLGTAVLVVGVSPAGAGQDDERRERRERRARDADPIGTATFGDVTVDVTELKRTSGRTVTLRFTIVNGGNEDYQIWDHFGEFVNDWTMGGVYLFDEANSTKYLSLRETEDQGGGCVCTEFETSIVELEPGRARSFFVKFPAPPRSTTDVSVVLPPLGPVDGVEIED